jgi:quercetin dioxygenase-like cupin family protein
MLNRRVFCHLCAALGVAAGTITAAEAQSAGLTRTLLSKTDGPSEGYVTILFKNEIAPGYLVARHTHPGIESTYVLEGGGTLSVEGRADQQIKAGDGIQVPSGVPHSLLNGPNTTVLVTTYVVEKDKPLASPAPK